MFVRMVCRLTAEVTAVVVEKYVAAPHIVGSPAPTDAAARSGASAAVASAVAPHRAVAGLAPAASTRRAPRAAAPTEVAARMASSAVALDAAALAWFAAAVAVTIGS